MCATGPSVAQYNCTSHGEGSKTPWYGSPLLSFVLQIHIRVALVAGRPICGRVRRVLSVLYRVTLYYPPPAPTHPYIRVLVLGFELETNTPSSTPLMVVLAVFRAASQATSPRPPSWFMVILKKRRALRARASVHLFTMFSLFVSLPSATITRYVTEVDRGWTEGGPK